jgi:hypothetical protein
MPLLWSLSFLLTLGYKYITPSGLKTLYFMSFNKKTYPYQLEKGGKGGF